MIDELKELLDKEPFESFRIISTSGDRYTIENPHNVALGESRIGIFPPRTNRWIVLRLNQITALESIDQATA